MSGAMRLNESENSHLHKNANSTLALSGGNGPPRREESSVATNVILKKKAEELCLEIQVMSLNLACVLVSNNIS